MNGDLALLVRVTASLVVVVLLALIAARLARRGTGTRGRGDLRVRERVGLTRDTAAVVIETDGRRLLVGVSPGQVSLLADLGDALPDASRDIPGSATDVTGADPGDADGAGTVDAALAALPRQGGSLPPATVRSSGNPLSRKAIRELDRKRRLAVPPTRRGTGSVLDPRTWQQGIEALRDLTARRG